jgi:hypothetical protein
VKGTAVPVWVDRNGTSKETSCVVAMAAHAGLLGGAQDVCDCEPGPERLPNT